LFGETVSLVMVVSYNGDPMITRADAIDDGGLPRPLTLWEDEERARTELRMVAIEAEFRREFGAGPKPIEVRETGPEPWNGFLDLSLL
jgi:hypothetical protein